MRGADVRVRIVGAGIAEAAAAYKHRWRPRTDWVRRQTHRRDRTRHLPVAVRDVVLKRFGRRIFRYRPPREPH